MKTGLIRWHTVASSSSRFPLLTAFALLLACGVVTSTCAQQTIFNVPNSDILDRGKTYVELDMPFKLGEPSFSSFVPRLVIGLGGRIEAGLNVTGNVQPGLDKTTLVPTIKWEAYTNSEKGLSLNLGNNLLIPIRNRSYRAASYAYAQVSKSYSKRTRITAGGYYFTPNAVAPNAHRAGGQFGFEHSPRNNLTIAADWLTGRHANGYFTPGFILKLHTKVTGYFGYSIGNSEATAGNHFFLFEVGMNLN
jgi:hypothetical protein